MPLNFTVSQNGFTSTDGDPAATVFDLKPLGITFKRKLIIARWTEQVGGFDFTIEDSTLSDASYVDASASWQALGRTWDFNNGTQYQAHTRVAEYTGSKQYLKITATGNGSNAGDSSMIYTVVLIDPTAAVPQYPDSTNGIPPASVFDWGVWGAFND